MRNFLGKYRGTVEDNVDRSGQGRIRVRVPAVLGDSDLSWAMPCVPYAGPGVGFFAMPPVGANVWVEFEGGDPDYPIWTGCFWHEGEAPVDGNDPALAEKKVLKTEVGTITLNDSAAEGGMTIEAKFNSTIVKIVLNRNGIEIDDGNGGKITLRGRQVSVNDGALEVT